MGSCVRLRHWDWLSLISKVDAGPTRVSAEAQTDHGQLYPSCVPRVSFLWLGRRLSCPRDPSGYGRFITSLISISYLEVTLVLYFPHELPVKPPVALFSLSCRRAGLNPGSTIQPAPRVCFPRQFRPVPSLPTPDQSSSHWSVHLTSLESVTAVSIHSHTSLAPS